MTGALEIERWTRTVISSKNAFMIVLVFGWTWCGLELSKRYAKRPAVRWAVNAGVIGSAVALVNVLGFVPPI